MIAWYISLAFEHNRNMKTLGHLPKNFFSPGSGNRFYGCPTIAEKITFQNKHIESLYSISKDSL